MASEEKSVGKYRILIFLYVYDRPERISKCSSADVDRENKFFLDLLESQL